MRIFFYEFVTGGGFFELEDAPLPEGSLLSEGHAMWSAFYEDLLRVPRVRPISMRDWRLGPVEFEGVFVDGPGPHRETFARLAKTSDAAMLIAPEFDLHLYQCAHEVERCECRLLSPSSHFIRLAGDKTASSEALRIKGVRVPRGQLLEMDSPLPADFNYPAILKPNDGTGSLFLQIADSHNAKQPAGISMRLEEQIRGMPCSASFLCCGDQEPIPLPPMEQLFSDDGAFRYHGGRRILDEQLVTRATRLGRSALNALPLTLGYVGFDIVLGDRLNGSEDHIIEVNPRLTTSYIGLCRIATTNLAEAMLEIAFGHVPSVEFSDKSVEFLADGTIL